jgi:gliding motility-associated-like protein
MVYVFNAQTNSEITEIAVGKAPLGMTLSPNGSTLYVANSSDNTVSLINTSTNIVTNTIVAGNGPGSLVVSNDGSKLYVTNYYSNLVSIINTANDAIIAAVPVGTEPITMAISPDGSRVYVTNEVSQTVSIINTANNTVVATVPVGNNPLGISITSDGSQVYVANNGSETVSVINTATNTVSNTIPTGDNPTSYGSFISSSGCPGLPVTFTITVNPSSQPLITSSGILNSSNTIYGTPSSPPLSFTISGNGLTTGILVTPPAGFEVSTNGINFSNTITVGSGGTVPSTIVYIRLAATSPVNSYSGNIVLSSPSASNVNINVPNSTVSPAVLTITANNQTKTYGMDNPELTLSYSGFVNNEDASVLMPQPTVSTSATVSSPVGKYPIKVSGAGGQNYDITYVPGILSVIPINAQLFIPNTFTPNGDGINDTWVINYIEYYPNATVNIFNRYGEKILTSIGYGVPWDGTYKGVNVPVGTYYYIIDTKSGNKPLSGWVAVIR